jgi:hypothetical protein
LRKKTVALTGPPSSASMRTRRERARVFATFDVENVPPLAPTSSSQNVDMHGPPSPGALVSAPASLPLPGVSPPFSP